MALFAFVVIAWGLNWVIMKVIVEQVTPLWAAAIRTIVAAIVLAPMLMASGQFIIPRRGDVPIILVIALFHMVAFAAFMTAGLRYVPVGRSIVLGYTTPLWVAPAARLFLKESQPPRRLFGIVLGLALAVEGPLQIVWNVKLAAEFAYTGVIGTALGFWAMAAVNRQVPATTTALGVLATPIVGMAFSALFLGERIDAGLVASTAMILLGIAIGATAPSKNVRGRGERKEFLGVFRQFI